MITWRSAVLVVPLTLPSACSARDDRGGSARLQDVAAEVEPAMPRPYRGRFEAAVAMNETCTACHDDEARQWAASRHHDANTNAAYRAAFAVEPTPFCRGCHAPESDGRTDPPQAVGDLGVGCVTCHLADDGAVITAASTLPSEAPHPIHRSKAFGDAGACAACHEFQFPGAIGEEDPELMQTTVREHARSGSRERCATCHMPRVDGRRSHAFSEVRDPKWLRDHLSVSARRSGDVLHVVVAQTEPGHAFPTGDLFRRLEVGCELRRADGGVERRETKYLSREFEVVAGSYERQLLADRRVFSVPIDVELHLGSHSRGSVSWWVSLQRVAAVGTGTNQADARIDSETMLHSGELAWKTE